VWAQVKWTEDDPETARYACESCGVLWNDGERHAAVREAGRKNNWIASKPFKGIAGFHINEIYSPFVKLTEMVASFLEAKKLPETLQTFVNTSLAEVWEEIGTTIEPGSLLERREQYGVDTIPEGALMLTAGVDTQDDRIEVQVNGWGIDEENWIVAQEVFRGDPGKRELWDEVDEYLKRKFTTEDGRQLLIESVCVDSGGHHTNDVYQFVVGRKARRVWAIKGMGGPGKLAWPKKATRTAKSRAMVFIIGVDTIKGVLYGRLTKVLEPGSGFIHFPATADDEFCKQLTSEKCTTKYVKGRPTLVWAPREKGIKQEVQDCWVYAYAAFVGRRGPELIKRLARRLSSRTPVRTIDPTAMQAAEPEKNVPTQKPNEPTPQTKRSASPPRRRGWVRNW
jgi:phage terminase large subunit GpA-like protein